MSRRRSDDRWLRRTSGRRRSASPTDAEGSGRWSTRSVVELDPGRHPDGVAARSAEHARLDGDFEGPIRSGDGAPAVEEFFERRYGRESLYLPSARLGLYLLFRQWLRPGDRLLMSPINDDVVFFTVLAAGLVPVVAPVDPTSGNIDPTAIDEATWTRLRAILTTNLYGTSDRVDLLEERSRRHGLLLLEDAAHAFDSRDGGRRIGTFGKASVFSLNKFIGIPGGVVTFAQDGERDLFARRIAGELRRFPIFSHETVHRLGALLTSAGVPGRVTGWLGRTYERATPHRERRRGHRMRFTVPEVVHAQRAGGGLDAFNRWVRMDNPVYRAWPLHRSIQLTLHRLEAFDGGRQERLDGVRKLRELGYTAPDVLVPSDTALLRVPLFVRRREAVIARLARRGFTTHYVYDPPLDLYAPELVEALPSPPEARMWSRDVLPVNPLAADRFIALLRESPGLIDPVQDAS